VITFLPNGWQRVAIVALLTLPLLILIVLMSPMLLTWPLLSDGKRRDFRDLGLLLINWIQVVVGSDQPRGSMCRLPGESEKEIEEETAGRDGDG
jgi:hypothetical protein